jgi:uncharacterized protein (DUF305 family)
MSSAPRLVRLLLAAAALVVLAACGGADPTLEPPDLDEAQIPAAYNEADVAFLQGMRPHHEEAVRMAELVAERTDREELNRLAQDIIGDQTSEIMLIEELLAEAGVDPGATPPHDMDQMGQKGGMGGMMGDEAVRGLAALEGEEFERRFMEMMIEHHQGAIDAAEQVLQDGENPRVAELAEDIRAAQAAEIAQLQQWLREWFGV